MMTDEFFDRTKIGNGYELYTVPRYTILDLDPQAVIRAYEETNPKHGGYSRMWIEYNDTMIAKGRKIPMPEIGATKWRLGFMNGRHRTKWAALKGVPSIPFYGEQCSVDQILYWVNRCKTESFIRRTWLRFWVPYTQRRFWRRFWRCQQARGHGPGDPLKNR